MSTQSISGSLHTKSNTSVLDTFCHKNIFVTGCTGFVGKVLLEKILRSVPNIGTIYLLVRARKGSSAIERFNNEIISSECFNRLRNELGITKFNELINNKCVPVIGELTQQHVGLSDHDLQLILSNVTIILHCAAVVDFNERLDRAIELNVLGTLRMLDIAKRCHHMSAFVHVSTCYVNSNRRGWIDETVYPLGFEPESILQKVGSMQISELDRLAGTGFLGEWPNTYTYTKAMTENLLSRRHDHIPVAIVRPSIVGAAYKEPTPGWVDALTAAGAVYIACGLGVLKFVPGKLTSIADIVPVDYVVNVILSSVPAVADQPNKLLVLHASTSTQHPKRWGHSMYPVVDYFTQHPAPRRLGKPTFKFIPSPQEYQLQFFLRYSIPSSILGTLAEMPYISTHALRTKSAMFNKLLFRVRLITESFKHFIDNEWLFNNRNTRAVYQSLSDHEKSLFSIDLSELDWLDYTYNFCYGIMRYCLHADMIEIDPYETIKTYHYLNCDRWAPPVASQSTVQKLAKLVAWDAQWVYQQLTDYSYSYQQQKSIIQMKRIILSSQSVIDSIAEESTRLKLPIATCRQRADSICDVMFGIIQTKTIASMAYTFRKVWRRIYSNIRVEKKSLAAVRSAASNGPVIYIPTHRSYIDFLIVSYVALACQLPIPYIAAGEDFLGIKGVRNMFRNSGAFFIRRSFAGDELYSAIFSTYVAALLSQNQSIEFFIEGTRSRSGKMLHPKLGMLSIITNAYLNKQIPDTVSIVPVTINYEKTMEDGLYSNELLGDSKVKESLHSLLKSSTILNVNFGDIDICLGQPINIAQYTKQHRESNSNITFNTNNKKRNTSVNITTSSNTNKFGSANHTQQQTPGDNTNNKSDSQSPSDDTVAIKHNEPHISDVQCVTEPYDYIHNPRHRKYYNKQLAYYIVNQMTSMYEIMPTNLIATILIMYRNGITKQQLMDKLDWLCREIKLRGGSISGFVTHSRVGVVEHGITQLNGMIIQRQKNLYEPNISNRILYKNMLGLSIYRNKIIHLFFNEGVFACSLYSFDHFTEHKQSVTVAQLTDECKFLTSLLHKEFIGVFESDYHKTLQLMCQRNILHIQPTTQYVEVSRTGETHYSFLCSLFWPFIDSYYVATMILYTLQPDRIIDETLLLQRTQWLATTLYHESMLTFYEACSLDTLRNAFSVLHEYGVIHIHKNIINPDPKASKQLGSSDDKSHQQKIHVQISLVYPYTQQHALQELIDRINKLRKQPPVRRTSTTRNLIADIPILAKM